MCGIAGILKLNNQLKVTSKEIEKMIAPIYHRGPDDSGVFIQNNIGLGFRRLSIIDLSEYGHQPMCNYDKSIWIVFNGEIYNFQELRKECENLGYSFSSESDTEVILALYQIHGENFINRLRGMFGFAIWDNNEAKLILARDRIGKKPLYYYFNDGIFVFASELKSIKAKIDSLGSINQQSLNEYFTYGYISSSDTIYSKIKKLKPSHIAIVKNGTFTERKYWEIRFEPNTLNDEPAILTNVENLISEAVKIRMISDVPLGAFLSGGIDSSLIVAMMAKHSSAPIKTFTIGFDRKDFDESIYAKKIAHIFGTDHTEEIVKPNYAELIENILLDFDEPFGDSSALPTYILSKMTKNYVTVALSGDGGDELFGGYHVYSIAKNELVLDKFPDFAKSLFKSLAKVYPPKFRGGNTLYRASLKSPAERFSERRKIFYESELESLFLPEAFYDIYKQDPNVKQLINFNEAKSLDFMLQCQYNDFKNYMVDDILVKVDRMSMLNSLEVRSPLLDYSIAELAFKISPKFMNKDGQQKYILKKILEKYLPKELIYKKKQGFALPLRHWFNNELFDFSHDYIFSNQMRLTNLFNFTYIEKIFDIHKKGRRDMSYRLWLILAFSVWIQKNKIQ